MLHALPPDTGMAFVLVQHLEARHESLLSKLLSSATRMPVTELRDGMRVVPDHVYVIPPNADITIANRILHLSRRNAPTGRHMPIDHFLQSLAEDQGAIAIGVILSGTASDGTLGLKAIKAEGGITFAQDPESAKYDGMPRSAIAASCVDFVLPPEGIARELAEVARHPCAGPALQGEQPPTPPEDDWERILRLLRTSSGVDFARYKKSTIKRRVARRMALRRIDSISGYAAYLENNPKELDALYQDILIHVTSFFREPEVFEALQAEILPKILAGRSPADAVRVWVPGCSSGEEAYSLAICLSEALGKWKSPPPIQIFATDLSNDAIEKARAGVYAESALGHISPQRLRRFFTSPDANGNRRVSAGIRETCIFARHDLTKDPPYSRLDLISCRNVLIYFEPVIQKRVLSAFHYALRDTGFLLLGKSETLAGFPDFFSITDRKNKFFTRRPVAPSVTQYQGAPAYQTLPLQELRREAGPMSDLEREADRVVWDRYAHSGMVIDDQLQILHIRGDVSPYLNPAPGKAALHVNKMLRDNILFEVRAAVDKVRLTGQPVRREPVAVKLEGRAEDVSVEVRAIRSANAAAGYYLLLFEKSGSPGKPRTEPARPKTRKAVNGEIRRLENELTKTKEYLQAVIREQETVNEELQAANEEALSSNEELQSTNEELETAKEELQSSNEELITLNEQGLIRNAELAQLSDDLTNVLSGIDIPILMLDGGRRIRRFTPTAEKLLHLLLSDIGRPLDDIRLGLDLPDLSDLISAAIDRGRVSQREVSAQDGKWYSIRILPYRTAQDRIDGALIALVNIHELKQVQAALRKEGDFVSAVLELAKDLLVVALDREGRIVRFNRSCQELTGYSLDEVKGKPLWDFLLAPEETPAVKALFSELFSGRQVQSESYLVTKGGRRVLISWSASAIVGDVGDVEYIISAGINITERQRAEERFRLAVESAPNAMVMAGEDGRIVMVNAQTERLFGYGRGELLGKPVETLVPEPQRASRPGLRRHFTAQPQVGPTGAGRDLRARRKDGTTFPVEIGLNPIETAKGTLVLSSIVDISERKRAEETLRESEERFRNMADTAPVMIWVSGPDALCTFFNKGWLAFTGRSIEQERGNGWTAGIHSDDREACLATYSNSFEARRSFQMEYRLRRADGEYRWLLDNGVPRFGAGGDFEGYIGSCIDITDLKRAQEEALSRQKLESVGVLAAGIAHDFNNLLGSIMADTDLASAQLASGSPPSEEIQRIGTLAARASEIVRELMVYAGRDTSSFEMVDISRIVEEMVELLKVSISKHAVLKTSLDKNLPAVKGHAPQIRQVAMNLIVNASEAIGEKDGMIMVTTSRVTGGKELAPGSAAELPQGDYLRLAVADTGCGMTAQQRARVFDPFYTTKYAGRGLGLAVVQGIVRAHNGAIQVISEPGQGATFQVFLPCADQSFEPAGADREAAQAERSSAATGTVFLVEDEDSLRRSVSKMLGIKGFSVIEAADGSTAIAFLRTQEREIDLMLLDLTIPGAGSREVIEEARRSRPHMKIVLTSAYSPESVLESLKLPEDTPFIRKPFQLSNLVQLLRDALAS